jgi:hypothetical protein
MSFGVATVTTNKGKNAFADKFNSSSGGATFPNAPKWAAMGTGATGASRTAVAADTLLSTEIDVRAAGAMSIVTTSVTGDTAQNVSTLTALGARSVDEFALFDSSVSSSGSMSLSATQNVISLNNTDTLQTTAKIQFT